MSAASSRGAGLVGELLDGAVHQTVARFGAAVPAFIIADVVGGMLQFVPSGRSAAVALFLIAMMLENRARVVFVATFSHPERRGIAWRAALRHRGALALTLPSLADIVAPYLAVGVGAVPFWFVAQLPFIGRAPFAVGSLYVVGYALAFAALIVALIALLLIALVSAAATVDVVLDGAPVLSALRRWLARCFRVRSLGPTVFAAGAFVLLVAGVPLVLDSLIPWGRPVLRQALFGIPEGIADAIAMGFVLRWRDMVLEHREGTDIVALLNRLQSGAITEPALGESR